MGRKSRKKRFRRKWRGGGSGSDDPGMNKLPDSQLDPSLEETNLPASIESGAGGNQAAPAPAAPAPAPKTKGWFKMPNFGFKMPTLFGAKKKEAPTKTCDHCKCGVMLKGGGRRRSKRCKCVCHKRRKRRRTRRRTRRRPRRRRTRRRTRRRSTRRRRRR